MVNRIVPLPAPAHVPQTPYVHIGDNKLSARLQYGRWQLLYAV